MVENGEKQRGRRGVEERGGGREEGRREERMGSTRGDHESRLGRMENSQRGPRASEVTLRHRQESSRNPRR